MFDLKNKVAVITGAGSGIGQAIALCFGKQGATVCVVDINEADAHSTTQKISAAGGHAQTCSCDVSNHQATLKAIQSIIQQHKRIDILINCAGIAQVGSLETTREEDFDKIFQVNVKGMFNTLAAAIHQMKKQQKGVILNMASVAASVGVPERFSYSMSKGAVVGMTISIARDYVKSGIRCNCISPARVHTPFVDGFITANYPGKEKETFEKLAQTQPIGRMAKPEEVAHLALYLCSDEASFITGCDYPIDGGFTKLNN